MKIHHKSSLFVALNSTLLITTLFFASTTAFSKNPEENSLQEKTETAKKIERRKKFLLTSYQYEITTLEDASNPITANSKKYILGSSSINNSNKTSIKNSVPIITENNLTYNKKFDDTKELKTDPQPTPLIKENNLSEKNQTSQKQVQNTTITSENKKIKKSETSTNITSKYKTRTDLIYKYSSNRQLGRAELFLPFYQTNKNLVFADIRYWLDNNSSNEGNLGLGYRQIFDDEYILGGYGFFDRKRSQYNHNFSQITTGAELLTVNYDFRANLYSPIGTTERAIGVTGTSTSNNYYLNGYNVVYTKQTDISSEYALKGYDIEIGRKLPFFNDFRAFIARYKFAGQGMNVSGYRYRGLYNFLESENSRFFLEAEHSRDNARNGTSYIGFRYSYNFGNNSKNKLTDLEKRMTNQIVRDLDIVTQNKVSSVSSLEKVKGGDGNDQKIIYVNNDAASSGNGTIESPYKTLVEAQNSSSSYNIIYVYRGNATSSGYDQGIALKDYQKIYGQNIDFKLSDITNNSADSNILMAKTDYSLISNTTGAVITTAKSNVIAGLDISSTGQIGINYNDSQSGVTINNNYIHNNTTGISITNSTYDSSNTIQNNIITNNSVNGIAIASYNSSTTTNNILNNTINSNTNAGFYVESWNNSVIVNNVLNNSLNLNNYGIYIESHNSSSISDNKIKGNEIKNNISKGISIDINDSSKINLQIDSN